MEDLWYIYRDGLQYGPYSQQQMTDMLNQGQLVANDSFFNRDYSPERIDYGTAAGILSSPPTQPMTGTFEAQPINSGSYQAQPVNSSTFQSQPMGSGSFPVQPMNSSSPRAQGKKPQSKVVRGLLIAAGIVVVLFIALVVWGLTLSGNNNLKLSKPTEIGSAAIGATGGDLAIEDAASSVNGLSISIPEGAYNNEILFKVSTAQIERHKFGTDFNPVTPLITIDNGHLFADEPMTVSIPISIGAEDFAMAFYYDKDSGNLEGIPVLSLDETQITIVTSHFSDIVVTKIPKAQLEVLKIDTKFVPGLDDWQFVNYGSFIEPKGHCAGQSISSMWYFYEKYQKAGEKRLFGLFDNNGKTATKKLDADDSWGYRFASVVQRRLDFDSNSKKVFNAFRGTFDDLTYYAFAYSLLLTKQPQYTGICYYDKNGDFGGGHALVAYKIVNNLIYVADPNYPGITTRVIQYDLKSETFAPYESGATAKDIEDGKSVSYPNIGYFAVSSMINWSLIGDEYKKMVAGKAGDGLFPADIALYVYGLDSSGKVTKTPLKDGYVITTKEMKQTDVNGIGKMYIAPLTMDKEVVYQIYDGAIYKGTPKEPGMDVGTVMIVELKPGNNDVGISYYRFTPDVELRYVNFYRFNIKYIASEESSESASQSSSASSSIPPSPTVAATPTVTVKPTQPAVKEYDYQAALAAWMADFTAAANKTYDDNKSTDTYTLQWVNTPHIEGGNIIGAHVLWRHAVYKDGRAEQNYIEVYVYEAATPGNYLSLGELKAAYPQFQK